MGNSVLFIKKSTNVNIDIDYFNLNDTVLSEHTYLSCLHPTDAKLFILKSNYVELPYKMSILTWMNIMQKCSKQLVCKYYLYRFCYWGECIEHKATIYNYIIKTSNHALMSVYGTDDTNIIRLLLDDGEIHQINENDCQCASCWNEAFLCFNDSVYII